jgi:hypothetical protein
VHLHLKAQKKAFKKGPEIAFKMSRKSIKKQPLWLTSPLPDAVCRAKRFAFLMLFLGFFNAIPGPFFK